LTRSSAISSPPSQGDPYATLAAHYDAFFSFHREWFQSARNRILHHVFPTLESACDLACGTGRAALTLAARGIRTYALDSSPAMCRLARANAREARATLRAPLTVHQADMRDFSLPRAVDLILCNGDAVNHLPRRAGLALAARSAARALRPGGYYFFDVNNWRAFERLWPQTMLLERPGVALLIRGSNDPRRRRGISESHWFLQQPANGLWLRHSERLEEVCWTPGEIRSTLRRAGFTTIRAFDSARFAGPGLTQPGCRTFYLARLAL